MSKFKVDVNAGTGQAEQASTPSAEETVQSSDDFSAQVATIGVVVLGVAVVSAELLPGVVIGVAAALAPKYLPKLGTRLQPLFNSTVRSAYKLGRKAQSAVGEIQERVNDITDERFPSLRDGIGDLTQFEDFGSSGGSNLNCFHLIFLLVGTASAASHGVTNVVVAARQGC
jgi:hypothetical protein